MTRRTAERRRTLHATLGEFVGQQDDRARDLDFSVADLAAGHRDAMQLGGAEFLLVKLNRLRGVLAGPRSR